MAYITIDDVKIALRITSDSQDARLQPIVDAVNGWAVEELAAGWDQSGSQSKTFYDVFRGQTIRLPVEAPESLTVQVGPLSGDLQTMVADQDYVLMENGELRLTSPVDRTFYDPRYGESPLSWQRLVVSWTWSGGVPDSVKYGLVLIAASTFKQQGGDISALQSESLGGYSYSRAFGDGSTRLAIPERAKFFLRPFYRRRRARAALV